MNATNSASEPNSVTWPETIGSVRPVSCAEVSGVPSCSCTTKTQCGDSRSTRGRSEAEVYFQQALAVARRQQAKALELRAALSLARLWQQQGKREAARQWLGEVYG